ncbi:MAG TPA: LysM peptidoglycan-binding domain-containing protein [Opitutaceae bacterium]|nr:LysM peptidoglycan-binding domain-containing protein [Opitutaceae bacterium]
MPKPAAFGPPRPDPVPRSWLLIALLALAPAGLPAQSAADVAALRQKAEAGDPEAQVTLGNLYAAGRGVAADAAQAVRWYREAAEKGMAGAHLNLGLAYEAGRGVAADERQAFRHFLMAAEQGLPAAQLQVGNMYAAGRGVAEDAFEANLWFRQAAEKGVPEAQFNLALAYEAGRGVRKDENQAVRWYQVAADRGLAPAQFRLGVMREEGRGGPENPAAAAALYRAAAEQGYAPAQNNLGLLLAQGAVGVAKDPVQGHAWLALAAEGGVPAPARDLVAQTLSPEQRAAADRMAAELRSRRNAPGAPAASGNPSPAYVDGLEDLVTRLRAANEELANTNARLVAEKAQAEQRAGGDASQARLVDELRAQGARLAGANQQLITEKELAEREKAALTAQLKDAEAELGRLRSAAAAPALPAPGDAEIAGLRARLEALAAQKNEADAALGRAREDHRRLTEENARLQQAAASQPAPAGGDAPEAGRDSRIRNLERDNERLNDEVKRATRELLSLNTQLRNAREQRAGGEPADGALKQENSRLARAAADAEQKARQAESDLAEARARLQALEGAARPATPDPRLGEENERLTRRVAQAEERAGQLETDLAAARERLQALEAAARRVPAPDPRQAQENDRLTRSLAEAERRARELQSDLTAARERVQALERSAAVRPADPGLQRQLVEANAALEKSEASVAELTGENDRLGRELAGLRPQLQAAAAARDEIARLTQENQLLRAAGDSHELATARREIAALEGRLREALAARPAESGTDAALARLEAQVAELTGENDRLERDLETARKAVDAALAAQQQAVTAARPDAYQMEIRTLQDRVKQLEATLEEDRGSSARELAAIAGQLQRTRDANRALTEANRALLAAQESKDEPSRAELDEALARIRDLTTAGDELRRQVQSLAEGRVAAEERAEKLAADLAALQARTAEADKAAESHGSAVAELTGENERLTQSRDALARQVEALRGEVAQMQQSTQAAERQKVEAERSASLNVNAMAAQLAELRRDLESARASNARLLESNTALERERSTVTAQLRNENASLNARLAQAQSTLDQIASAARLGTPASQIAAGRPAATAPAPAESPAESRYHTVADGDSLSRISLRYYGTAARWQEIFEANRDELRGANTLRVGQRLRIP